MIIVRLWVVLTALLTASVPATASVLVTIKPVHSIVSAVTAGVAEPVLLLDGTVSPHLDRLKPSTIRALHKANLVVWVGEGVESFLAAAIGQLPVSIEVMTLSHEALPAILPLRDSNLREHNHGHADAHGASAIDSHLWLDPDNAAAIADLVATRLSRIDPPNKAVYLENAQDFKDNLTAATDQVRMVLADDADKPYLVFHDSLQYLEAHFALNNAGVVTYQPQVAASASHLRQLQRTIKTHSINCLLSEPQFTSRAVRSLVNDTHLRLATVDPLASEMVSGPELYSQWLIATAKVIQGCLSGTD